MNKNNLSMNKITAPASKSYLQRALAISALAEGETTLTNISWCDDSIAAKNIIEKLGCKTIEKAGDLIINSKALNFEDTEFSAGEAGLSIRMFSPIFALSNKEIIFTGKGSLLTRPIGIIADALTQLGAKVETNNGLLPLKIKGKISASKIRIDGSLSSQLLTGLLIALPLLDGDSEIIVDNLKSIPYIDMTLSIIQKFGVSIENENYKIFRIKGNQKYKPTTYNIEGDWSGAAFFLILGAVNGSIEVENLDFESSQADKEIITVLKKAGAKISTKNNSVIVEKNQLNSFKFDATNCPDLFPPIACLASQCSGTSIIKGVSRLTHKESNRAEVLKQEFANVGIKITLDDDYMHIIGSKLQNGTIDSHNDHRIAMMGGILNEFSETEIKITNKEAINKSYPDFFKSLNNLNNGK